MKVKDFVVIQNSEPSTPYHPERYLLAALLERAFWDLDYISIASIVLVRDAVEWFTGKYHSPVPYALVCESLELSASRQQLISDRVKQTKEYLSAIDLHEVNPRDPVSRHNFAFSKNHQIARLKRSGVRHIV